MTKFNGHPVATRRGIIKGVLAAGVAAPAILRAQSAFAAYPDRPVKIIVANTPGGPSDIVGRITAAALQQSTGKTFIIENIGGAGGNIGFSNAARSEPDGYTILLATNALSVNVSLYNKIPFDPLKDFVGISELATSPNTFVVKSDLPAKSMKELSRWRGPIRKNSTARHRRSAPHLKFDLEVLKLREKLPKLEDVVFKGGGDAIGLAERDRTTKLRFIAAGRAAHKSRHAPLPCGHGRKSLARHARRADHAGSRLPGLCLCHRHRPAGASKNSNRARQVA